MQRPAVAIVYTVANLALGLHLWHGAWSMFQSLGVNNPRINAFRRWFAYGFAAIIVVGNVSFPVMVQAHVIRLLPPFVREPLDELRAASSANSQMTLTLALSYGGRESIARAESEIVRRSTGDHVGASAALRIT